MLQIANIPCHSVVRGPGPFCSLPAVSVYLILSSTIVNTAGHGPSSQICSKDENDRFGCRATRNISFMCCFVTSRPNVGTAACFWVYVKRRPGGHKSVGGHAACWAGMAPLHGLRFLWRRHSGRSSLRRADSKTAKVWQSRIDLGHCHKGGHHGTVRQVDRPTAGRVQVHPRKDSRPTLTQGPIATGEPLTDVPPRAGVSGCSRWLKPPARARPSPARSASSSSSASCSERRHGLRR